MRFGDIGELALGVVEVPLKLTLFFHRFGFLVVEAVPVTHLSLYPLNILLDSLLVSLD